MSGIIPIPKDNASGQFNAGISASSLALVLKAGEGASFPQPITDSATSLGSGTLLNCTGIQALGVAVGDFIYNLTDSTPSTDTWSGAVVLAVSANSVTTSPLTGGSDNLWQSSDEWAVKPFVVNASIRTGAVLTGAVTQYEKILITERSTDTLSMPVASGYRGFDGTTPNTFSADDFVTIEVDQSISDGMRIALANVFIQKAEKDDTMLLDGSNAMTAALQMGSNKITGLGDGVNPQDAVTRAQLDAVASASSLTGERDNTFAVRVISWNTATVGGNYEVKRGVGVVDSGANVDGSGSYRDSVPLSGDIEYTVEVTDDEDVRVITPILYFDNTVDDVVPVGYYGDGGDGAFAGGAIERGSVYNFSSFILASDAVFSAGGKTIIFVEGDLTIPSAWKLDFESGTQTTTKDDDTFFPESISVGGSGYATATGESSGGTGGAGGTISGNAGGAGGTGKFGIGGIGGNGGSHGSAGSVGTGGGGGGGGGGGSSPSGGGACGGPGGNGGAAGTAPEYQNTVLFIVGGDILIEGDIHGRGATGTTGSVGADGSSSYAGTGGAGGGGGAGGAGPDGLKLLMAHAGSYGNTGTTLLGAGSGGAGSAGGAGGTGCGSSGTWDGTPGAVGGSATNGSNGVITTQQL